MCSSDLLGAVVAPGPFVASEIMAPVAIRLAGSADQQSAWLPRIVDGERQFAVAAAEWAGARAGYGVREVDGRMEGEALFAIDIDGASDYLIGAADGRFYHVASDAPGVTLTHLTTVDRTRGFGLLGFDGAQAELLPGSEDARVINQAVHAGRIALAADTLGAAQTMLDKSVAYAGERRQIGRAHV